MSNTTDLSRTVQTYTREIEQYLQKDDYNQAAKIYEELILVEPEEKRHYWNLGLVLLLSGDEFSAQAVWFQGLSDCEPDQVSLHTSTLVKTLLPEAEKRELRDEFEVAYLIRCQIQEIDPDNIENILRLIKLSIDLNLPSERKVCLEHASSLISNQEFQEKTSNLAFEISTELLAIDPQDSTGISFIDSCVKNGNASESFKLQLFTITNQISHHDNRPNDSIVKLLEICLILSPNQDSILKRLAKTLQRIGRNNESIPYCQQLIDNAHNKIQKISAYFFLIRGFLGSGGNWESAFQAYSSWLELIHNLIDHQEQLTFTQFNDLIAFTGINPYFEDSPAKTHTLRKEISQLVQSVPNHLFDINKSTHKSIENKIKIGYISTCFKRHSVAWIARWLLKYHNSDRFHVNAYSLINRQDNLQYFICQSVENFVDLSGIDDPMIISKKILQDEIDILIDLDSITSSRICKTMALKPAPVQVTWLGSDASGISTIDYFIADNYVLPESAQEYYDSKILRLPPCLLSC